MPQSPHTPKFRAMASQESLDGLGSYNFLASKYQISSRTLRQWVAKYRLYGLLAFQNKKGNTSYPSDFKTMCVEAALSGDGNIDDIVAKCNISGRQVLRDWISMYNADRQSMSRVGHCIDNGPTGGFWGIIKSEMYQMYDITDKSSLRFAIKDYLRNNLTLGEAMDGYIASLKNVLPPSAIRGYMTLKKNAYTD